MSVESDSALAADSLRWQANDIEYDPRLRLEREHNTHHKMRVLGEALGEESREKVVAPKNRVAMPGQVIVDGAVAQFARDAVESARCNVPDCRLGYLELQHDPGEIDNMAKLLGLSPIDWHPEPCKHKDSKWMDNGVRAILEAADKEAA